MIRDVFWTPVGDVGVEHLRLSIDQAGIAAESVVVGTRDAEPFRIYYEVECDDSWQTERIHVSTLGRTSRSMTLRADGEGTWLDEEGGELLGLSGGVDVDISATPFTNTLPIQRLPLSAGESTELTVAYVSIPDLDLDTDAQRYTCLDPVDEDGGRFRYDAVDGDFTAELVVDPDGLVVDYSDLFTRIGT